MHDLVTAEALYDAAGSRLQGTENTYELRQQTDTEVFFPALVAVKQSIYGNSGQGCMSTTVYNTYDAYGNLASYKETATNYELDADIAYHDLQAKYIVSVPKHIAVKDKGGKVYRERSAEINSLGDVTSITIHNGDKPSVWDMTYDDYGNLTSLTKPENHRGQRMRYDYTYDDVLHALVTSVKDAYGYTSSTVYDYKWAVPLETSDLNGNKMRYTYDDMGRQSTILGPKEIAAGKPYTIKFEYHPAGRYTRTVHYAPEGDIETYTFADSLMRAVQTKQTGVVWTGGSNQKVSIVSGRAILDAFGRTIYDFFSQKGRINPLKILNANAYGNFVMYENLKKNDLNSFDSYRGLGILQGLSVGNLGLLYGTSAVQGENGYNKTDFSKSYGVSLNANPARFDVSRGGGRTWIPFF